MNPKVEWGCRGTQNGKSFWCTLNGKGSTLAIYKDVKKDRAVKVCKEMKSLYPQITYQVIKYRNYWK